MSVNVIECQYMTCGIISTSHKYPPCVGQSKPLRNQRHALAFIGGEGGRVILDKSQARPPSGHHSNEKALHE